jgi:hypothetical protein
MRELIPLSDGKLVARARVQPEHEPLTAPLLSVVADTLADTLAELIESAPEGWHVAHVSIKKDRAWRPARERSRYFLQVFFSRER